MVQISKGILNLQRRELPSGLDRDDPIAKATRNAPLPSLDLRKFLLIILSWLLCGVHLLLPIERGFPTIKIFGYPLTASILTIFFSAVVAFLSLKKHNKPFVINGYVFSQLFVVISLTISSFLSDDIEAGLFVVLNYFSVFVLGFLVVSYFFECGFRYQFVVILCCVAFVAALVGIMEGLFRFSLPFYKTLFLNYGRAEYAYAMIRPGFRAWGTSGNPLTYAITMVLCLPFAFELKRPFARYTLATLLFVAVGMAVSTTALIMLGILAIGIYVVSVNKTRLIVRLALFLLLVVILAPYWSSLLGTSMETWRAEFDFMNGSNPQFLNIKIRYELFQWTLDAFLKGDFPILCFGYGLKSSILAVSSLRIGSLNTLDNAYAALLFEGGLMGLGLFLLMELRILFRHRMGIKRSLHWYSVLGLMVAGLSFTTIFYSTFNFVWGASVAALAFDTLEMKERAKVHRDPLN